MRLGFSAIPYDFYESFSLHRIPEVILEHDLQIFFTHRLSEIRKKMTLSLDWPGDAVVQELVKLSVPSFICAATICREFEDPLLDPVNTFGEVLAHGSDPLRFGRVYLPVLSRLLKERSETQQRKLLDEFRNTVRAIVIREQPLSVISLSKLINKPTSQVKLTLNSLRSVLYVPDDDNLPVRLLHLSFREFLLDPDASQKSPFWVDERVTHQMLAKGCLSICQSLQTNLCRLPSSGTTAFRDQHSGY